MQREQLPIYALALAVLVVGLAWVGVPVGTVLSRPRRVSAVRSALVGCHKEEG